MLLALAGGAAYEWQREKPAPAVEEKPVAKPVEKPVEQPKASEAALPAPAEAAAPVPPAPAAAAQPVLPPGIHRLVLRMQEEAWLEVRDGAGTSLVSSLNPAGSERVVRGRPPFQLVIGNAAHVELSYDGEPVDLAPHMRGEVARFALP